MADKRSALGAFGEAAAAAFLTRRGFVLLQRNWRCAEGEIDLILRDGDTLVFAEVRTRRGCTVNAAESVGRTKQARLVALAYHYLETASPIVDNWRIDVLAIQVDPAGKPHITYLPNAVGEA